MINNFKLRNNYTKLLQKHMNNGTIKVVTGMRGIGKTSIIKYFINELVNQGINEENIVYLNFESKKGKEIKDCLKMYYYLQRDITIPGKKYLFLDEITNIDRFERGISMLFADKNIDIYLINSNMDVLSDDLNDIAKSNITHIPVFPLSFKEFLYFNKLSFIDDLEKSIEFYLKLGALPQVSEFNFDPDEISYSQRGLYSNIICKEILERNVIGDYTTLNSILEFLANNIGQNISPYKIGTLIGEKRSGFKTKRTPASRTVESHIDMLNRAFIFDQITRFDIKKQVSLKTLGKYYMSDIGLLNVISRANDASQIGILQNIVYNELKRRGFYIQTGKIGDRAIDFIANKNGFTKYIQVTDTLLDKSLYKKISGPLLSIDNSLDKVIIYCNLRDKKAAQPTPKNILKNETIEHISLVDFLLAE